jgi:hypothetical protein
MQDEVKELYRRLGALEGSQKAYMEIIENQKGQIEKLIKLLHESNELANEYMRQRDMLQQILECSEFVVSAKEPPC